jgi:hypothetical protein
MISCLVSKERVKIRAQCNLNQPVAEMKLGSCSHGGEGSGRPRAWRFGANGDKALGVGGAPCCGELERGGAESKRSPEHHRRRASAKDNAGSTLVGWRERRWRGAWGPGARGSYQEDDSMPGNEEEARWRPELTSEFGR